MARQIDDQRLLGYSLEMLYTASAFNDVLADADAVEEGYRIFNKMNDNWGKAMASMNMARLALARGNYDESQKYFGMLKELIKDDPCHSRQACFASAWAIRNASIVTSKSLKDISSRGWSSSSSCATRVLKM